MRKLFNLVLLIVALLAVVSYASDLTHRAVDGAYGIIGHVSGGDAFYKTADTTAYDTIATTGADTLYNKIKVLDGNEYVLTWSAITGTGSDSVELLVGIRCFDKDGRYYYSNTAVDTISATTGAIELPLNSTIVGQKYSIILTGGAANGGQVIINRFRLLYRRPLGRMQ